MQNKYVLRLYFISIITLLPGILFNELDWSGIATIFLAVGVACIVVFRFVAILEVINATVLTTKEKALWSIGLFCSALLIGIIYILTARRRL